MSYCSRSCRRRFTVLDFKSWALKRLFMHFRCKFRHRRSTHRPRFPIRAQNFGDSALFYVFLHLIFWLSAIFLLPVCLTYWPRNYTTRVDPYVDNFHQVWSWYDHALPSYSVFACWYVTWLCDLDLLTLNSCCAWWVTLPTLLLSLKTLRLSVLDLWVITFPVGYHWKCVRGHCSCAVSRDPCVGGQNSYIFGLLDPDLPIHYATSVALRWK